MVPKTSRRLGQKAQKTLRFSQFTAIPGGLQANAGACEEMRGTFDFPRRCAEDSAQFQSSL
jgi:hypothetical protein